MFNSTADLMNASNFAPYAAFSHQPGTSTAMTSAAAATQNLAAFSFEAAAAGTLMHNAIRNPHPYRAEIPRGNKRERTKFDQYQLERMEAFFQGKKYPDGNEREEMAKRLNLTDVKVQIWFKNRRAKERNQKHLDELMARSRGDLNLKRSATPIQIQKKKRKTESPLPDPVHHQQQQQQQLDNKNGIKNETMDGSVDYGNNVLDASTWEEHKDFKAVNYPIANYGAFQFTDAAGTFQANNAANWIAPSYPSYNPFGYFNPTPYYSNGVTPQTAAAAAYCNDFYAAQYASIPNFKDPKVELPPTQSPNISTHEIEQQYTKFT